MTTTTERFSIGGRAASVALLRARIGRMPGLAVLDAHASRRGLVRLLIDVRETGMSGYEIGRRMRAFSNVPLEFCREHGLVVVIDEDEEIAERGERLLFALGHACQHPAGAVASGVYTRNMSSTATRVQILRQLETVAQRLESPKLSGPQRMALLRHQAELGDRRDVLAERARRAAAAVV